MKIVIVTPLWLPVISGITKMMVNQVKTLQKRKNFHVSVISREGESDKDALVINAGLILFVIKTFLVLHKRKPDVIHSNSQLDILMPGVLYKLFRPKTRLIHTLPTEPSKERRFFKKKMLEWAYSKCDAITTSENIKEKYDKIAKVKIKARIAVIHTAFSRENVNKENVDEFKERYSLINNHPVLSFNAPLEFKMKVDGLKILMKAFTVVIQKYPNARLLVVGDGTYRKDLERFAESLDIKKNITFTGFLDNVFIPLSVTDIYMHILTQGGGIGIAVREAMCVAKPIIATESRVQEILVNNENAILVPLEPEIIANGIIELYEDKEKMKKLGENAKRTVEENYNWGKICDEYIKLYQPLE